MPPKSTVCAPVVLNKTFSVASATSDLYQHTEKNEAWQKEHMFTFIMICTRHLKFSTVSLCYTETNHLFQGHSLEVITVGASRAHLLLLSPCFTVEIPM